MIVELKNPIPVVVKSKTLPNGMTECDRKGWAYAWNDSFDSDMLWLVCFDQMGEWIWVPNPEIRANRNWSVGRRL